MTFPNICFKYNRNDSATRCPISKHWKYFMSKKMSLNSTSIEWMKQSVRTFRPTSYWTICVVYLMLLTDFSHAITSSLNVFLFDFVCLICLFFKFQVQTVSIIMICLWPMVYLANRHHQLNWMFNVNVTRFTRITNRTKNEWAIHFILAWASKRIIIITVNKSNSFQMNIYEHDGQQISTFLRFRFSPHSHFFSRSFVFTFL